jgi:pimeloyl-ACP methyl ester carboxylesterase
MPKLVTDRVVLHYQQLGNHPGRFPDLVLIHGLGANLAFWYLGIAAKLAANYRVLVYDLRGHGNSSMPPAGYTLPDMAQDLQHLLQHLGIRRAHLVGHSFGARVALCYTMLHGHSVETLTLADAQFTCLQPRICLKDWPYWKEWQQQLRRQGVVNLPDDSEIIDFPLLNHLNQVATTADPHAPSPAQRPSLRQRGMGRKGTANWERLLSQTTARHELEDQLPITVEGLQRLTLPLLAMFGEYSHCLPSCRELKQLLPHSEVAIIPEVGHFHPALKPDHFLHHIEQFLTHQDVHLGSLLSASVPTMKSKIEP